MVNIRTDVLEHNLLSHLAVIPAQGGEPSLLVRFDDPARPSSRPEFVTDGKRFYFTIPERESDIWQMELKTVSGKH